MWCSKHGIMHLHTKLFHKRLLGTAEDQVYCHPWDVRPQDKDVDEVRYTFYGIVDQHLIAQEYGV